MAEQVKSVLNQYPKLRLTQGRKVCIPLPFSFMSSGVIMFLHKHTILELLFTYLKATITIYTSFEIHACTDCLYWVWTGVRDSSYHPMGQGKCPGILVGVTRWAGLHSILVCIKWIYTSGSCLYVFHINEVDEKLLSLVTIVGDFVSPQDMPILMMSSLSTLEMIEQMKMHSRCLHLLISHIYIHDSYTNKLSININFPK